MTDNPILQNLLKKTLEKQETPATPPNTEDTIPDTTQVVEVEHKYQHYNSARISTKLITKKGRKIIFANYEFITRDKDLIEYLDEEIDLGIPGITKGKLLTAAESNPMETLRRKHIADFLKQQKKDASDKALGITRDMGNTKQPGDASINPAGTDTVAS